MGFLTSLTNRFTELFSADSKPPQDAGFLDFRNETLAPYLREIVRKTQSLNLVQEQPNAAKWLEYISGAPESSIAKIFRKSLSGATLVDVGSSERWESMYEFAKLMGASNYVGIDKFWPTLSKGSVIDGRFSVIKSTGNAECRATLVKADALDFLSSLKDSSCCVAVNGIDGAVIHSPTYHKELARQIERIVPKGGIAFGIISYPLSLIATNSVESPLMAGDENPILFSAKSMGLCMQPAYSENPVWEDHSPISFDRLLLKK